MTTRGTMTRKDYVLLAEALASARPVREAVQPVGSPAFAALGAFGDCCRAVADALARENPRFERDRFLKACGIE